MSKEQFNPHDFKSHEELPEDQKDNFAKVKGGFITKSADEYESSNKKEAQMYNDERTFLEKIFHKNKISYINIAHEEAIKEDWAKGSVGREKLVADLSEGLNQTPEAVDAFIDRCDEIMSGVPSAKESGDNELTHLQRKIKGRLENCLWSYKKGDAVDAIMRLYSSTEYSRLDALQSKLANNAGEELMKKMKELRRNQPNNPTDEDYEQYSQEDIGKRHEECQQYWNEQVVPTLIEVLRKSEKN